MSQIPISAVDSTPPVEPRDDDFCTTQACKDFAKSINQNLAKNYTDIDPCSDFAQFVCGGWEETHTYRPDQSGVNTFSVLNDENTEILRTLLENPYPDNSSYSGANETAHRENFEKMQAAFNVCMDQDTIKKAGVKPLQTLLNELPSSQQYGSDDSITNTLIWLQKYGVDALVSSGTGADDKTPQVVTIFVGGGVYGLPSKEYYNRSQIVANYTKTIADMFAIVNEDSNSATYEDLASKIVDLEGKLAHAQPDPDQENDVTYNYNPKPFSEVDELVSQISFSKLLNAFIPKGFKPDQVIVSTPDYFPQLSDILSNTSSDALKGYFQWSLINSWAGRLHSDYNKPIRILENQLSGRPEDAEPERWRTCLNEVDSNLGWIESGFFIERRFSPEAKKFGEKIVDDIKAIYTERLSTYAWMSKDVQEKAKKKVANIVKKVGYPTASPSVLDPLDVRNYYTNVSISGDFFDNGLVFNEFGQNRSWNALLKPDDKLKWEMTTPTVNAYYSPTGNEIVFPAGIMQNPFFNSDVPEYISYGSFGVVAGHELTHGFDNSGSQYDENGAYRDWWDNSTRANFDNRTKCFVDQYSSYTIPGLEDGETVHVNGKLTLGENIADSGGVSAAYAAWTKRNAAAPNQLLPDLPKIISTPEKLFFLSFGTTWCQNIRREAAVQRVYTDPHAPNIYRIIGSVANSRAFKEAYNCPVQKPDCELW
ncbi:Endothelin-converting enzyme protein [Lasiodiplodia theobromae]|nr:Endothelin-converting enzyme protein [Lasiodiplodia theobromae]KAF4545502.1 Endothelin-converting enzyme protein [Lasiodiplodia theobromae]